MSCLFFNSRSIVLFVCHFLHLSWAEPRGWVWGCWEEEGGMLDELTATAASMLPKSSKKRPPEWHDLSRSSAPCLTPNGTIKSFAVSASDFKIKIHPCQSCFPSCCDWNSDNIFQNALPPRWQPSPIVWRSHPRRLPHTANARRLTFTKVCIIPHTPLIKEKTNFHL